MSFVGGGGDGDGPPNDDAGNVEEYADPEDDGEDEETREVRRRRADGRLPVSFRSDDGTRDEEFDKVEPPSNTSSTPPLPPSSALVASNDSNNNSPDPAALEDNPYLRVVSALSPSEIVARFTSTADPSVRAAAKQTILGLVGSLPKMAFEVDYVASGARLASLMFQLQMTGYMFKNAEYRMELSKAFVGSDGSGGDLLLSGGTDDDHVDDDEDNDPPAVTNVRGRIKVDLGVPSSSSSNKDDSGTEVDAAAFTSELRAEVEELREELRRVRDAKEERAVQRDLMEYIRTLPPQEMARLTNTMSDDVLTAMKGLVGAVMLGIDGGGGINKGEDGDGESVTPATLLEQSSGALTQLCMWQLVVGYNLRELEVREEMRSLGGSSSTVGIADDDVADDTKGTQENEDDDDDFSPGLEPGGME